MDPVSAFALLVGEHSATIYGGSISAILVNAPGTGMNIATTTFDGYPLAQQGRAGVAFRCICYRFCPWKHCGSFCLSGTNSYSKRSGFVFWTT